MSGGAEAPGRGRLAEEIAAAYLRMEGLRILDRNRRAGAGEIDLVARQARTLVFVEVRLRDARAWVPGAASIGPRKRLRLRDCARRLAREEAFRWPGREIRFDVVTLTRFRDHLRTEWLRQVRI